ncbi:hydantoinase/oxoprolinase family protein [Acinetobacter baumannii]|uniref:hydantoinase/oxoprolinase family protein n=1 Tax=Acinetobacter baumannii TaxID=470 RepID=UPI0013606EBE|nr:hydantoinase/oxoprolinase family protein [Acinetobacter baumannii]MDC4769536.1 hydantoinase/oxoprolinase family protein [Acinetobacter baumannii]MDC5067098.1 hydantoinase/oxoprolinase family protein [Acinetobacter baumannii]MDC5273121.1 hydantoinase/oxoprolinase family protein [Acinetobacter baumannii]MDC5294854.1 hydantoinase/oxoprolinase family protein [Acinetobacter baumannii]MDC5504208.1 hydantoinase/oxoprolinase family protein [Acinetobacter baumannii]
MKRVSVDIGGTFTDCFVVWDGQYIETKALTTHHNLAQGFNEALGKSSKALGVTLEEILAQVDSVRYATTLGTNALIEHKGPKIGLLITAGYEATVPISRARGYGEGLDVLGQTDLPNAARPEPLVLPHMIRGVRERIDFVGDIIMPLDEDDLRQQIRELVDEGAQILVVATLNSVVNPVHEQRIEEILLEEYPSHLLGAIPVILSHRVAGRKGEYVRATSAIVDGYLHSTMYHALSTLEQNLRAHDYTNPMLVIHNSGGMAQLNSTDALQTIHSGPVSGIAASEHLALQTELGNVVATDMGGTSYDIGIVVEGGVKHYDFNPVIDRWLVSVPMVHLVTLGSGGGSIATYDRMYNTVKCGPESAGSDPGPACYDRGGMSPTTTDADLVLGYLDPDNYAGGSIPLNKRRALNVIEDTLCDDLDCEPIEAALLIREKVDSDMANGLFTELRARGYDPKDFTMLAYGGNGPLHCCGIAQNLSIDKILAPPFSSVFSAVGAGNIHQLHIHEKSLYMVLYDSNHLSLFDDYKTFNDIVDELKERGTHDLIRQGVAREDVQHRLELDMRYGNQLVQTTATIEKHHLERPADVLKVIEQFSIDYGKRFGEGSQAPEAGIRINTIRVASYVEHQTVQFKNIKPVPENERLDPPTPETLRKCYFVGYKGEMETPVWSRSSLKPGVQIKGPAVVTSEVTTFLVNPGWTFVAAEQGASWFLRTPLTH